MFLHSTAKNKYFCRRTSHSVRVIIAQVVRLRTHVDRFDFDKNVGWLKTIIIISTRSERFTMTGHNQKLADRRRCLHVGFTESVENKNKNKKKNKRIECTIYFLTYHPFRLTLQTFFFFFNHERYNSIAFWRGKKTHANYNFYNK